MCMYMYIHVHAHVHEGVATECLVVLHQSALCATLLAPPLHLGFFYCAVEYITCSDQFKGIFSIML